MARTGRPRADESELLDGPWDELAVSFVCAGTPMRLRGADRAEAVRRLAARGMIASVIAERTMCTAPDIRVVARRIGLVLPKKQATSWWETYMDPGNNARKRIARAARTAARAETGEIE